MTGQSLLDRMELVNSELQLQAGEANVTKGLVALNVAQDYFEALAATRPKLRGSKTGTVTTAAQTETTSWPAGVLRLDRLHLLDANGKPVQELRRLHRTGGHAVSVLWPWSISIPGSGSPRAYWADGTNIYWSPTPAGISTVRWYGFMAADDITASGTFSYPDIVALPLAAFAVRLFKGGLDDPAQDVAGLAQETFLAVLKTLELFNRDGAEPLEYTQVHRA